MAKKAQQVDSRQLSLLDLLKQSQDDLRSNSPSEKAMNIHTRLCHSLTNAIRKSNLSRWEIAGRMSHLLGVEVSKTMIDAWSAESKEGHRIPAEYLPAFCAATACREPLQILTDTAGLFCLPGPETLRAEIQRHLEEERRIRAERRKREMFLKEMEGGK